MILYFWLWLLVYSNCQRMSRLCWPIPAPLDMSIVPISTLFVLSALTDTDILWPLCNDCMTSMCTGIYMNGGVYVYIRMVVCEWICCTTAYNNIYYILNYNLHIPRPPHMTRHDALTFSHRLCALPSQPGHRLMFIWRRLWHHQRTADRALWGRLFCLFANRISSLYKHICLFAVY